MPQADHLTCCAGTKAVMKRLLPWIAPLLILLCVAMEAAHTGSIWLWTGVTVVAVALMIGG